MQPSWPCVGLLVSAFGTTIYREKHINITNAPSRAYLNQSLSTEKPLGNWDRGLMIWVSTPSLAIDLCWMRSRWNSIYKTKFEGTEYWNRTSPQRPRSPDWNRQGQNSGRSTRHTDRHSRRSRDASRKSRRRCSRLQQTLHMRSRPHRHRCWPRWLSWLEDNLIGRFLGCWPLRSPLDRRNISCMMPSPLELWLLGLGRLCRWGKHFGVAWWLVSCGSWTLKTSTYVVAVTKVLPWAVAVVVDVTMVVVDGITVT